MKIRASSMPRLFECPASACGDMNVGTPTHEGTRAGSAVHEALVHIVARREPDLDALAIRHDVDRNELGVLSWYGRKAWAELAASFPNAETEVEIQAVFGPLTVTGHIDLRSREGSVTNMADWKSGRVDRNHYHQFIAYAAGEFAENPECQEVHFVGVWLREQEIERYTFTREDVQAWSRELAEVVDKPNEFRVGAACEYCPRSHECPALRAIVRRDVDMFSTMDPEAELQSVTSDQLIEMLHRAKLVASFAESVKDLVKAQIRQAGPIRGSDGTVLDLVPENGKRVVDALKAWPILQENFSDKEIASCVTVSVASAEALIGEKAGKGDKGRAKKRLGDALTLAGAITQGVTMKLKETKPRKLKEISK